MLVIDENLHDQRIMAAISTWYPGQVPLLSRAHSLRVPLGSPQGMHAGVVGGGIRRWVA
jgi:hypothetical protein